MKNKGVKYFIKDWYIFKLDSSDNSTGVYIREIIDSGCHEYATSKISDEERYDIISDLTLDLLINVLGDCYSNNNKPYNAESEALFTYKMLERKRNRKINNFIEV